MLLQNGLNIGRGEEMNKLFAEGTGGMPTGPDDGAGKLYGDMKRARHFIDNPEFRIGGGIDSIDNAHIGFSTRDKLDDVVVLAIQIARVRDRSKIQLG
jgi:hypothetical protein